MPAGSKVHEVYEALLEEGHGEKSAARIAQSVTGEVLATGKPPKHENCSEDFMNGALRGRAYLHGLGLWVDGAIK